MMTSVHTFQSALNVWPIRSPVIAVMNVGRAKQVMETKLTEILALYFVVYMTMKELLYQFMASLEDFKAKR
jgi:hypothetical protein